MSRAGWKFLRDMRRHLVSMSLVLGTIALLAVWFERISTEAPGFTDSQEEAVPAPDAQLDSQTADALTFPR